MGNSRNAEEFEHRCVLSWLCRLTAQDSGERLLVSYRPLALYFQANFAATAWLKPRPLRWEANATQECAIFSSPGSKPRASPHCEATTRAGANSCLHFGNQQRWS